MKCLILFRLRQGANARWKPEAESLSGRFVRRCCGLGPAWAYLLFGLALFLGPNVGQAGRTFYEHPDYLIQNWLATEGVPENSALAIAQTPEGYLWVGSSGGLLRFNGDKFERGALLAGLRELSTAILSLSTDRSGRLWVGTYAGIVVLEKGHWHLVAEEGVECRTIAENVDGRVLVGTADGRVFEVKNYVAKPAPVPPGLTSSGVFLVPDRQDGILWLANRGFIGRLVGEQWQAIGPQPVPPASRDSLIAGPARDGGLWVYNYSELRHYRTNGAVETYAVRWVDQPRELCEDHRGRVWIASMNRGLVGVQPGGETIVIGATNGLAHNTVRYVFEDAEENLWVGTTSSGLYRLKPRQFFNLSVEEGLPDRIVRTVTAGPPGQVVVGTHGGGTARIATNRVVWVRPATKNDRGAYAWSVLHDRRGRTWTGTFGNGLLLETNGVERVFPLPREVGPSICALLEDAQGRVWVGGSSGLGVIEGDQARFWPLDDKTTNYNVRALLEDRRAGVLWVGTTYRVVRVDLQRPGEALVIRSLPRDRVSSLSLDSRGGLWVGVADRGLFHLRDGKISALGWAEGLPANTVGSMIEDGLGYTWLGSDRGILRISTDALQRVIQGQAQAPVFTVFDQGDGMETSECSAGYQPAVTRDSDGRLWFATIRGVVRVDPARLRLNSRPPTVMIERLTFADQAGTNYSRQGPLADGLSLPPGSTDLELHYAALSYTAPEKVQYAYRLEGAKGGWVQAGGRRVAAFHALPPGAYRFQVKAANNDGVWNETGASLAFEVQPFIWQTLWFRCLLFIGLAGSVGLGGWRLARARYERQVERIESQRALEREQTRLAAVLDATSDLVAFADRAGHVLHLNPAGRRLLGFGPTQPLGALKLTELFPDWAASRVEKEGRPILEQRGTWEAELALRPREGREIPISQVMAAHRDAAGQISFYSTIARDISERKRAEEEKDRLNLQLAQAQKMESVGRLAGGVAHDFNNMLQVILGNVELVLEQTPRTSVIHSDLVEIRKSAQRSADLTRQLLAFARKQAVSPRVLDLNETVGGMLKMLRRLIGEDIQLVWAPGSGLWPVRIDPAQIDQILANLAVNARDAITGEGQVTVQTANVALAEGSTERPADCPPGEYVRLSVCDSGKGMTPEVQEHLFEPFFTTKALGKGTGLGLATIFGIVKQNGGSVSVLSEVDHGATFRIYLPRAAAALSSKVQTQPLPAPASSGTVLLVEDEQQILDLGRRLLEQQGYTVLAAALPQTALNLAAQYQGRIQLLITDVVMPGMNGKELKMRLEASQPGLQVLFMSGYTADVIADHGVLDAGVEFIQKPFPAQELIEKVRRLLDDKPVVG